MRPIRSVRRAGLETLELGGRPFVLSAVAPPIQFGQVERFPGMAEIEASRFSAPHRSSREDSSDR